MHECGKAVPPGVGARDLDRHRIAVRRNDRPAPQPGHRQRQDARAAAEIERRAEAAAARQAVDGEEAAARRFVRAAAEGEPGIERDADAPGRHRAREEGAVDEETAGRGGRELAPVLARPVPRRKAPQRHLGWRQAERRGGECRPRHQCRPIGLALEIAREAPKLAALRLEAAEALRQAGEEIGERLAARLGHLELQEPEPRLHDPLSTSRRVAIEAA